MFALSYDSVDVVTFKINICFVYALCLSIVLDGNNIRVKEDMSTNIPGVFACGDITGGMLQVGKAVYEGAEAGLSAVKYLKEKTKAKEN